MPALAGVAERWNRVRINEPGKINRTLRHTLLIFVFDALLTRLSEKDSLQNAAKQGWLVSPSAPQAETAEDAQWAYLLWKDSKLQAAPELGAVAKEKFIRDMEEIRTLLVEPGLMMHMLRKWFALGAWLMIGARLRPARIERSPPMKEVQELVFGQDQSALCRTSHLAYFATCAVCYEADWHAPHGPEGH